MTDPIFIASGDIHLTPTIWPKRRDIVGDAWAAFAQVVTHTLALKVPLVLCGDIFDSIDPDSDSVHIFRTEISRLEAAGIPVYYYQGNHDKQPKPWGTAVHNHITYVGDGVPFKLGNYTAAALDFAVSEEIGDKIRALPNVDILFLHQAVKQALGFDGAWNCDLMDVCPTTKLVVMGDIHNYWEGTVNSVRCAYTGSTHARDIGQTSQRSIMVVNSDLIYDRLPLRTRFIASAVLGSQAAEEASVILQSLLSEQHELAPVVVCSYVDSDYCREWFDKLVAATKKVGGHIYSEVIPAEAAKTWQSGLSSTTVPPPSELLGRVLSRTEEPIVFNLVLDLLCAPTPPQETIKAWRDQFLATYKVHT